MSTEEPLALVEEVPRGVRGPGLLRRPWPEHWPLTVLMGGYPLWWLLGIRSFLPIFMAMVMLMQLFRMKTVRLPRGAVWWLIYLVWVMGSGLTLWVDAPYGVPGGGISRLGVFTYRLAWYITCGVVLVWVYNTTERAVPTRHVARMLGWMFVITVGGGLLGVMAPNLQLTSLVEFVAPKALTKEAFVRTLVHPVTASVQRVLGEEGARPTAPFEFANSWGSNFAMYLPFFLFTWFGKGARWRNWVAPVVLLLSAIPVVASLNRGLWGSLVVGGVFIVVQRAFSGRIMAAVGVVAVVAVAGMAFMASPLGDTAGQRLENPHSNERRSQLLRQTVASAAEGSPVVGFGSTRDVRGSFASIAGGGTPECPACRVPPLGTQGQLWLAIFATGLVGAAIFLAFFASQLLQFWRCRTTLQTIGVCLLLFLALQLFVYDVLGMPMYTIMIAMGLMHRERAVNRHVGTEFTVSDLVATVRHNLPYVLVFSIIGGLIGMGVVATRPRTHTARVAILLAQSPVYIDLDSRPEGGREPRNITIDTEAAMVLSERAIEHVESALQLDPDRDLRSRVEITAPSNTTVLNVAVTDSSASLAVASADALADAYLDVRRDYLTQRRDQLLVDLERQLAAVSGTQQLAEVDEDTADRDGSVVMVPEFEEDRLRRSIEILTVMPTSAGEVIRSAEVRQDRREAEVPITSGVLLGFLASCGIMAFRPSRSDDRPLSGPARYRGRVGAPDRAVSPPA